jgi:type I restriction enzyme S subunit
MMKEQGLRRFKPYPKYRDSGVEWLGELPVGWDIKRLKHLVQFRGGGTPTKDNFEYWRGEIPWVSPKDMKVSVVLDTTDKITAQAIRDSATNLVQAGAVLIVVRSGILAHSIPVALTGCEVTLNQDLKALIPGSELSPEYLVYLISGMQRELLVEWKKEGATVESLELELVAHTPTPLPAIAQQRAIAAFLDRETARIDGLVAKKERLIELLQEKRAALITRAVTKGLDPRVPMTDSGVEWLGQIPPHWEVKRIRHVVRRIEQGWSPDCENREADVDEWGVLKAGCVNRGQFVESEHKALPANLEPNSELEISPGDLLMSRASGSRELVGSVALVSRCRPRLLLCDKLFRFHVDAERGDRGFLAFAMNSRLARWQIEIVLSGGSGLANNIAQEVVKDLTVVLPPLEEQASIVVSLDREMARIDALMSKVHEAIDRLTELRTALIAAAVTGKIDVRDEIV